MCRRTIVGIRYTRSRPFCRSRAIGWACAASAPADAPADAPAERTGRAHRRPPAPRRYMKVTCATTHPLRTPWPLPPIAPWPTRLHFRPFHRLYRHARGREPGLRFP
jgi:hypothetical protein